MLRLKATSEKQYSLGVKCASGVLGLKSFLHLMYTSPLGASTSSSAKMRIISTKGFVSRNKGDSLCKYEHSALPILNGQ